MLRQSARALRLSSFGRENALKLKGPRFGLHAAAVVNYPLWTGRQRKKQTTGRRRQCGHAAELFRMSDFAVLKPNA